VTAFLVFSAGFAAAQTAQSRLPAGTSITFVAEGHFDSRAHPGTSIRAHLKDDLTLDGTMIAPAGTVARLIFIGESSGKQNVAIDDFKTRYGFLPVGFAVSDASMNAGVEIRVRTLANVEHLQDRYVIEEPFPFKIGTDAPASVYTPTPARTAPPIYRATPRPAARSTRAPAPSPVPSPSDPATKIPG